MLGLGEGEWAAEEAGRRARLQQQQQAAQGSAREPLPYYGMWSNVRTLESWLVSNSHLAVCCKLLGLLSEPTPTCIQ